MKKLREEKGSGSTVTIILLLIIVIILGVLFYLRSNNLIQVESGPKISMPTLDEDEPVDRQPSIDVKSAVEDMEQHKQQQ